VQVTQPPVVPKIPPRHDVSSEDEEEDKESNAEADGGKRTPHVVSTSTVNTVLNILSAFVCYGS
jgi:hypothetical protein